MASNEYLSYLLLSSVFFFPCWLQYFFNLQRNPTCVLGQLKHDEVKPLQQPTTFPILQVLSL